MNPRSGQKHRLAVVAVVVAVVAGVGSGGSVAGAFGVTAESASTDPAEEPELTLRECVPVPVSPSSVPTMSPTPSPTGDPEPVTPDEPTAPSSGPASSEAASPSASASAADEQLPLPGERLRSADISAPEESVAVVTASAHPEASAVASPSADVPAPTPSADPSVSSQPSASEDVPASAEPSPSEDPSPSSTPSDSPATTVLPCPPMVEGLSAAPGINAVDLSWTALDLADPSSSDPEVADEQFVTGIRIVVSRMSDSSITQEVTAEPLDQHVVVSGLANGVEYQATARAMGPRGLGPASAAVTFTPTTGVEGEIGGLLMSAPTASGDVVPGAERVTALDLAPDGEALAGIDRIALSESVGIDAAQEIAGNLAADDGVDWAEPDLVVLPSMDGTAAGAQASDQWSITGEYGIGRVVDATAGAGVTVAVIDTGITEHPELRQRLVPGYDFVSDPEVLAAERVEGEGQVSFDGDYAGDFGGLGRDADPTDPGDWRSVAPVRDSSWHGTHIAGVIAEAVPGARIQPIRALSWRGGLLSDVAAAVVWASGASVDGAPVNGTPSKVINLSFSVQSACPRTLQAAIDTATQQGSVVVAAAGNANDDAGAYAPGNCAGVVTVGATGRDGKRAPYSNYGSVVDFSAPGGAIDADGGVLAASNDGTSIAGAATRRSGEGTSIAAAHVSAALALIAAESSADSPSTWVSTLTGKHLRSFAGDTCDGAVEKSCGAGIVQVATGTAFTCEPVPYQVAATTVSSTNRNFYSYSPITNEFTAFGPTITSNNTDPQPLGYNTADNYLYAMTNYTAGPPRTMDLMRVDNTGTMTRVNTWTVPNQLNVGDFWGPDRYVIGSDYSNSWGIIDVSNTDAGSTQSYETFTISGTSSPAFRGKDMTVLGDTGYGLHETTLYILNLNTQVVTTKAVTGLTGNTTDGFGSAYADSLGNLYFFQNATSDVWRISAQEVSAASPAAVRVGSGPAYVSGGTTRLVAPNDGAICANAASPYSATISSESETSISATAATLQASVNPNSISTTVAFCYGTSSATSGGALTGCTTTASSSAFSSTTTQSRGITGLSANTTYYWQAVATSSWATTYGAVQHFTTTSAPVSLTQAATSVATTTATLNGSVNPGGLSSTVSFCFGTAADLTGCSTVTASPSPVPAGNSAVGVSAALTGLTAGTTYFARLSATNSDGTGTGSIVSFTTSAVPVVSAGSASSITSAEAQLSGTVNPKGLTSTAAFCYGTAIDLSGCTSVTASQSPLLAVDQALTVTADISGLSPATTYYVRISATNANGTGTGTIGSFTTAAAPLVVTTTTGALPDGTVGVSYAKTLTAGGGTAPYTWQLDSGTLPSGLSLNSSTGQIAGTPTVAGATSFVIEVTDAAGVTALRTFTITTTAAPSVTTSAATSVAGTTATVNGLVNPGNSVTTVEFCYGTAAGLTGCSTLAAAQSPLAASTSSSSVSLNLTGLTMGTTYYARVQATNGSGSAQGSIISFTTSDAPTATTGAATFLRTAGTEATLNGTVAPNGVATTVTFCYGTTPTLTSCTSVNASPSSITSSASATSVSQDITGLSANTVYYFAVRASNALGSTAGTTATFTTPSASAAGPTVSTVSPATGDAAGGETITITGTGFTTSGSGATVTVGGTNATITSRSSTQIVATTPAHTPGVVDVVVTNPDGQAYLKANAYTYTSSTRYSVTYNGNLANGGSVPSDATAYAYGATATVSGAGTMTRSGYAFAGWDTIPGGTGTDYAAADSITMTNNVTLYAQWTPVAIAGLSPASDAFGSWTVTNGATPAHTLSLANSGAASLTINAGGITVTGADSSDFAVSGGTCAGGGTVTGSASCTIAVEFDPSALGARTATLSIATSAGTVTSALSGTGVGTFTLSYDGNLSDGGSVPSDTTAYAYGATAPVSGAGSMTRSGYSFAGWNTAPGGTGSSYASGAPITITGDVTLFAQWTPAGGSGGSSSSSSAEPQAPSSTPTPHVVPDGALPSGGVGLQDIVESAFFRPRSAELSRRGMAKLDSMVAQLPAPRHGVVVYITAVAAVKGSMRENLKLANKRGASLRAHLVAKGVRGIYQLAVVTEGYLRSRQDLEPVRSATGKPLSTLRMRF